MIARTHLDRKARLAVGAVILVLVAGPILSLRGCISNLRANQDIVASSGQADRVIFVAGHTMLLEHGSFGRRIADWLTMGRPGRRAFEIGEQTFVRNSAELTRSGWSQISGFAQILKAHTSLHAEIVVAGSPSPADLRALEEKRAIRLHDEIVAQGIAPTEVPLPRAAPAQSGHALSEVPVEGPPRLIVLLSK